MADDLKRTRVASTGVNVDVFPPLVEAKLAVPSVRPRAVDRPRIRQLLDEGADAALTLVSAPAGYGKTTAVRAWCSSLDAGLAWVTLDAGDSDPGRFWRYVATAVDRVRPGLGRGALQRLSVPGCSIEDVVDELMNGIAALERALVLVLDDLHAVTDEECVASIDHAIAHQPPNVRVIVLTRADPGLRLGRLRAGGDLTELRMSELAFTPPEAQRLLAVGSRVELGREELELLIERAEGWPAALVLAGLWLSSVRDATRAVRAFGGENRFVADYLSSEVFASLDQDRRVFLEGTAVLGEFTAELCDAVFERVDSADTLAELERSNLFVSPLEHGGWYRMHALFAEFARAELASAEPSAATRIHREAAMWLKSRRLPFEAAAHAAAAGEHELVAQLLVEYQLPLLRNGAGRTFLHWVDTLPDECLVGHPDLAAGAAMAVVLYSGGAIELRRFLRLVGQAHEDDPDWSASYGENWALVARALTIEGGVGQAVLDGRRALKLAQTGSDEVLTGALVALSQALYFAGDLGEAWGLALQVIGHPDIDRRAPSATLAHTTLALVALERGQVAAARWHAEKAKAAVGRIDTNRSWLGANASAAFGAVLGAEGNLVEAEHELVTAEHLFRDEVASLHQGWNLVCLARVRVRRGRLDEAEATLRRAQAVLAELGDSGRVPALAREVEVELVNAEVQARSGELLEPPSEAELSVLRLLATDLTMREIGERLFLSPNTIHSHTVALYRKLGVHSRTDAVARAAALGLREQAQSPR